jgi:hypothetical protein
MLFLEMESFQKNSPALKLPERGELVRSNLVSLFNASEHAGHSFKMLQGGIFGSDQVASAQDCRHL